ncbi:MAG: ABC transporter ATP-binding protein [Lachnospiraceae bacterium]|jgi:ABC-2 type transport system ATP-binding protein|nr:ABC transporter ATP-binding protein [Lachnospiraceae bacterium]
MKANPEEILLVSGISKGYARQQLWSNVSFGLKRGEALGIRGSNGAGKSTLLRVLATLERPKEGNVFFQGEDIFGRTGRRHYRAALGYVPQEIALYPELSGYENLRFFGRANHVGREILEERIRQVCMDVGLQKETLQKRTGLCSGGMKRRLNLAAALLHDPQLLLLDEPTVGIDEASRQTILGELKKRREKGVSMIYVGHEEQEIAAVCTRCVRLEEGKWLEHGTIVECREVGESKAAGGSGQI